MYIWVCFIPIFNRRHQSGIEEVPDLIPTGGIFLFLLACTKAFNANITNFVHFRKISINISWMFLKLQWEEKPNLTQRQFRSIKNYCSRENY